MTPTPPLVVTQDDCEAANSIRAALYSACPDMPNYPADIVSQIIAAHRLAAISAVKQAMLSDEAVEAACQAMHDITHAMIAREASDHPEDMPDYDEGHLAIAAITAAIQAAIEGVGQ